MALIVTLGILAVIAMAVVALVVTLRIERLAARNVLERTAARQYVDVGLAQAMATVDLACFGRTYPVGDWISTNGDITSSVPAYRYRFQGNELIKAGQRIPPEPALTTSFQDGDCMGTPSTNMSETIRLFRGSITNFVPAALAGQATNIFSGWSNIIETNGQSGASAATDGYTAGRVSFLVINLSGLMDTHFLTTTREAALGEAPLFNTARKLIDAGTTTATRVFLSQLDLTAANNGNQVSNLVTLSYDPGPDVYFAPSNQAVWFGTRPFATNLATRFNINALTNAQGFAQSIATVSNLLYDAGVSNASDVAYNIYNYVMPARTPVPDDMQFYRTDCGIKDVPLINEVATEDISPPGTSNHYGVAVELWYPFVPHDSPDNVSLWVDVFTNDMAHNTLPSGASDSVTSFMHGAKPGSLPGNGISFRVDPLPTTMIYGSTGAHAEFFVGSTTNTAGTQPIYFEQIIPATETEPARTNYLPVSNSNPIWVWPRVFVGNQCVDEALVNVSDHSLYTWTGTGSWQYADLRANSTTNSARFTLDNTLGASNVNSTVRPPLMLMDAPMTSAGELRHIYAPGMTNDCLDLASPQGAACRDRFTVRATNSPMRGLVQANTPYTNIWKALLCDVPIGWTNSVMATLVNLASLNSAQPQLLAAAVAGTSTNTAGGGWFRFQEMLPAMATNILGTMTTTTATNEYESSAVCGDILAGIADRVSFRQNVFLVIVCAQRLSPLGRTLADQRAAAVVIRDAFTGRWVVNSLVWLTE